MSGPCEVSPSRKQKPLSASEVVQMGKDIEYNTKKAVDMRVISPDEAEMLNNKCDARTAHYLSFSLMKGGQALWEVVKSKGESEVKAGKYENFDEYQEKVVKPLYTMISMVPIEKRVAAADKFIKTLNAGGVTELPF